MKTTPTKNSSTTAELASATNKIATVIQNSTDDSKSKLIMSAKCYS
jgi:hypothetical protein